MSTVVRKRPMIPPTVTPMIVIMETPLELLSGVVEIGEEVEEGVMFPTVDSGRFTSCVALTGSNIAVVTVSRYAHAGTAVAGLILFGYLASDVNSCRKKQRGTHSDIETIELGQSVRHKDHLMVPNERKARENEKIYHQIVSAGREMNTLW